MSGGGNDMTGRELALLRELQALLTKYGVEVRESPDYDGHDNFVGYDITLVGEEVYIPVREDIFEGLPRDTGERCDEG